MKNKCKTISFNTPYNTIKALTDELDTLDMLTKHEEGSHGDSEGHAISYKLNGVDVFFAIIHSNGESYLLRADPELITEA